MATPPDDILLNKAAIIERCIRRLGEEARACPGYDNFTHIDALTLNIERAFGSRSKINLPCATASLA